MMAKTGYRKIVYPVTTLDQIGLPSNTIICPRCYGIETAEDLIRCISKPDTLRTPGLKEKCRQHLLEHGYLSEKGVSMENKKYFQVSYEVGNTYSSNIAIAECVDDVVDYYKADGCKGIGVSSITKEEAETSLRRHPGKPVIEIPKQERQKPSIPDELKKNLDMLCFSEDVLEVLYALNISTVDEIEDRLSEIKKKADFDTYNIISQAVRTKNAVIKATKAETSVIVSDQVPVMSSEEYEALAAEKANEAVDDGLKWTTIGIIYLAVGMKTMRDGKLYKRFNFRNFEEYCAQKGITRQQGAKYANIGDMLERRIQQETGNENVKLLDILPELEQRLNQSARNGKLLPILQNAGVEAGYLLAKLEDADLDEVIQTVNPEETNGADVKKAVKKLEAKHKRELEEQKAESEKEIRKLETKIKELNEEYEKIEDKADGLEDKLDDIKDENTDLKQQIIALENRPPQVEYMQSVEELQKIKELEGQNELITNEYNELDEENKQLRADLQEARIREQEALAKVDEIADESADATEEFERQLGQLREENAMLEKQLSEGGSFREQKAELNAYMKMLDKTMMSICGFIARNRHTPEARSCLDLVEHKIGQYLNPLKEEK